MKINSVTILHPVVFARRQEEPWWKKPRGG